MATSLTDSLTKSGAVKRALRRRVLDDIESDHTEREIAKMAYMFSRTADMEMDLPITSGDQMSSIVYRKYSGDLKFFSGSLCGQTNELMQTIDAVSAHIEAQLKEMEHESQALESQLVEEEVREIQAYSTVHHNKFVRSIDRGVDIAWVEGITDLKTGLPFSVDAKAKAVPGVGLTLPVDQVGEIPVRKAYLVHDETDFGDLRDPVLSTDPNNLLIRDKMFRHVILRETHDGTVRGFLNRASKCTVELELAGQQLINQLVVEPANQSPLKISGLYYFDEAGAEQSISFFIVDAPYGLTLMFEPVRTRYVKIKFEQHAPVAGLEFVNKDDAVEAINTYLAAVGMTLRYPESPEEQMQGKLYDFSLRQITPRLVQYRSLGAFLSRPVDITRPLGVSVAQQLESILVDPSASGGWRAFGDEYSDTSPRIEYYGVIELKDKDDTLRLQETIPLLDSNGSEIEILPVYGGDAAARFFPDMNVNKSMTRVLTATASGGYTLVVTSDGAHGITGATASFTGGRGAALSGDFAIVSSTATTLTLSTGAIAASTYEMTENDRPMIWCYENSAQPDPLEVYADGATLTIGADYQISIDGGSTWRTTFPHGWELHPLEIDYRSGQFKVRFVNPDYGKVYSVSYYPRRNQFLGSSNNVMLSNGIVAFSSALLETFGKMSTLVVLRSESHNHYTTPVVKSYTLKVREDVS